MGLAITIKKGVFAALTPYGLRVLRDLRSHRSVRNLRKVRKRFNGLGDLRRWMRVGPFPHPF